jgi:3D (Asp-Asp-Asp) domain-containing protein
MRRLGITLLFIASGFLFSNCTTTSPNLVTEAKPKVFTIGKGSDMLAIPNDGRIRVRTTAYSHTEADSLQYGTKNAAGENLKYGIVRSAAADWSRFPLGTIFKIAGDSAIYQIDDYGSALVGTNTIDIYKPTYSAMQAWGVRHVEIKVLKWGSFDRSADILQDRIRHRHCREMFEDIAARRS